jgi:hypothetical protein
MKTGRAMNFEITITPSANNGFIVKAGCCMFVFETSDSLLKAIGEYLKNPKELEKEFVDVTNQGLEMREPQGEGAPTAVRVGPPDSQARRS